MKLEKKFDLVTKIGYIVLTIIIIESILRVLIFPAPEEKDLFHYFFETLVGPFGAAMALFSTILMFMSFNQVGGPSGNILRLFMYATTFITIGMLAFALHGYQIIEGEPTRLILRSSVLISTGFFFSASTKLIQLVIEKRKD